MEKTIITAALTGAVTPKSATPHVPITPEEIAEDAYRCWQAGAAVVHLHMRDDEGLGTMDKERFKKSVALIKQKCDIVINCTTSGDNRASDEERMAHLPEVLPEIASFDAGSFNWMPLGVFANSPEFLRKLAIEMGKYKIKPEIEIFDSGMIGVSEYYLKEGVLTAPLCYQLVLGVLGGTPASVGNLVHLRDMLPKDATWSAFGIGKSHLPIMYATIAMGGHVRVGLEDNIYYSKGVLATNAQLVERAVRVVKESGKEPASPDEAREILGLARLDARKTAEKRPVE